MDLIPRVPASNDQRTRVHALAARLLSNPCARYTRLALYPCWLLTAIPALLTQRVAGLRLLLACLTAWGADAHPLTDDDFVSRLKRWAAAEDAATKPPPVRSGTVWQWHTKFTPFHE